MKSVARWRKTTVRPSIEVSALAAIFFALLFVFIMREPSSHDLANPAADRPHAAHAITLPGAAREDALHVTVQMDGIVYLDNQRIVPDQLAGRLREAVRGGAENKVYIDADRRARYGAVLEVLEAARAAGIPRVGFLVT